MSNTKLYQAFTAKARDLDRKTKANAKDRDFGLQDQGQGLTSLITQWRNFITSSVDLC